MKKIKPSVIIPKTFTLIGSDYVVEIAPEMATEEGFVGRAHPRKQKILVQAAVEGWQAHPDYVASTFFHEYFHVLFEQAGYSKLSGDEKLVEMLAKLHYQYEKSKSGRLL